MSADSPSKPDPELLRQVEQQIEAATAARKCHACGCFHSTVDALGQAGPHQDDLDDQGDQDELAPVLARARAVFTAKQYDCLGCPTCYPAIAANAFEAAYPERAAGLDLCPTEAPEERSGWPPLPGSYHVVRYRAPVAVCALNSDDLARRLADQRPAGLAVAGTLHTENLGIERLIRNVLANPHIRFLVLCGQDTRQAIGHLPGQTLASLFAHGIDERGRIRDARGKRPVLKNVSREQIDAFLRQVTLIDHSGDHDVRALIERIEQCGNDDPGVFADAPADSEVLTVRADEPRRLVPDRAGFLVVYPDATRDCLVVEHYSNDGVLDCVIEGQTPAAVSAALIERDLVSRLDHAAYLGRELARAERSLQTGEPYVQDRAPGELMDSHGDSESGEAASAASGCCGSPSTCGGSR